MHPLQRILGRRAYGAFRRGLCCRLGFHGPKVCPDGSAANVCSWGCGLVYNPNMWQDYVVTLKDGESYEVRATNEFHAGSVVVYGLQSGGQAKLDGRTGRPLQGVKVHRENIASIKLKLIEESSGEECTDLVSRP